MSIQTPTNPNKIMNVTFHLVPRVPLPSAYEINAPPVAARHYLSRAEYAEKYGADPAHVALVEQFAKANDLEVTGQNTAHRTVSIQGTVAALQRAFKTQIEDVTIDGAQYQMPSTPLTLPKNLKSIVNGVFGLDTRPIARRHASGISGTINQTFTPPEVAALYQFPTQGNGKGQTVAIIELGGGYSTADLDAYWGSLGISSPPTVTSVSVDGATNDPADAGAAGEVQLDIEVVGSVAPGANIVVYFARNTTLGFLDAINQAIHDTTNNPNIISISWGSSESQWPEEGMSTMDSVFQAACMLGISVFAAAGDHGSSDGFPGTHVNFPASSPHCTGCGGTSLRASGSTITSEVTWNDDNGWATGGGVSDFFPVPLYQSDSKVPVSPNTQKPGRGVPDIAANADPNTGYRIQVNGVMEVVGGTSAVAPLWAALTAQLNEALPKPVGFLNPQLYSTIDAARALTNITQGNNITNGSTNQWLAGPGWNPCTGLGSPKGNAILAALKKS